MLILPHPTFPSGDVAFRSHEPVWMRKKTSILTRMYYPEVPYLNEFADYYLTYLEFDRLHFIITDDTPIELIKSNLDDDFADQCIFYVYDGENPNHCSAEFLSRASEDYLFNVDFDEFLYLHGLKIHQFLQKYRRTKYFQFQWVLAPSTSYFHRNLAEIVDAGQFADAREHKSMALRKQILSWNNHSVQMKRDSMPILLGREPENQPFIIHFSSRGIADILSKCIFTLIFDAKWDFKKLEKLKNSEKSGLSSLTDYPHRFLLLKFQMQLPRRKFSFDFPRDLRPIDTDLQKEIVNEGLKRAGLNMDQMIKSGNLKKWVDNNSDEIQKAVESYLANKEMNFQDALRLITAAHP